MKKIELLPHNQTLYEQIVKEIENGERSIFYSEATGLGKSFIFMRLVQEYFTGKKILYIVPKIAIWENLTRYKEFSYLSSDIEMTTFAAFNKYDETLCEKYDAVFIDECHHMLSDIQGSNVLKFCIDMVSEGKFTFGLTATPNYQGEYVDEKCFSVSCYGLDVFEAIECGLLPKVKLALANIDLNALPEDTRARFSITGTKPLIERLIEEHSDVKKWLAYYLNKNELEQNVEELQSLFPDYKILKVYEGVDNESDIFKTFEESQEKVILMSVNKLLEGVHLSGVEGVLLYRNVIEFSTYMQIYGRLCSVNSKSSPVFLDIANAIVSINKVKGAKSSRFTGQRTEYTKKDLFDITASDYWTIELSDFLDMRDRFYKDVPISTASEASRALNLRDAYLSNLMSKKGFTIQEAIDFVLNQRNQEAKTYRGIPISTAKEASKALNLHKNYITNLMSKKRFTIEEAIDFILNQQHEKAKTYKGIPIHSPCVASVALNHNKTYITNIMRKKRLTIQEAIDFVLNQQEQENKTYKGIPIHSAIAASKALNHSEVYISYLMRTKEFTIEEAIDFVLNKQNETYKGIPIRSTRAASKALNCSDSYISSIMRKKGFTIQEAIDFVLNQQEQENETYKGIPIRSTRTASLALKCSDGYLNNLMSKKGFTIEEAIDFVLEQQEKKGELYKGIPINSQKAASLALNRQKSYIAQLMYRKRFTIQEAIDYALEKQEKKKNAWL